MFLLWLLMHIVSLMAPHATNYDGEDITNSGQRISYPLGVNYIPAVHYVFPIDQKWFLGLALLFLWIIGKL